MLIKIIRKISGKQQKRKINKIFKNKLNDRNTRVSLSKGSEDNWNAFHKVKV